MHIDKVTAYFCDLLHHISILCANINTSVLALKLKKQDYKMITASIITLKVTRFIFILLNYI